jgi:hypothetical protein
MRNSHRGVSLLLVGYTAAEGGIDMAWRDGRHGSYSFVEAPAFRAKMYALRL